MQSHSNKITFYHIKQYVSQSTKNAPFSMIQLTGIRTRSSNIKNSNPCKTYEAKISDIEQPWNNNSNFKYYSLIINTMKKSAPSPTIEHQKSWPWLLHKLKSSNSLYLVNMSDSTTISPNGWRKNPSNKKLCAKNLCRKPHTKLYCEFSTWSSSWASTVNHIQAKPKSATFSYISTRTLLQNDQNKI
jgi:hypothetical protein